jgi:hypothetical protein
MRSYVLALGIFLLPGCADPELDPAPSAVLEAPELSMPREPHKTADPPPPIREQRLDTSPQSSQSLPPFPGSEPAPVPSASTTGTVNALDRR